MRKKIERIRRKRNAEDIGICFEPLDPRLLLSGSWGAGMDNPSPDPQPNTHGNFTQESGVLFESTGTSGMDALQQKQSQPETGTIVDMLALVPAIDEFPATSPVQETASSENQATPASSDTHITPLDNAERNASNPEPQPDLMGTSAEHELVFINENVGHYEQLVADLQSNDGNRAIEVVVLDSNRDGIEQVSEILSDPIARASRPCISSPPEPTGRSNWMSSRWSYRFLMPTARSTPPDWQ
jgi:hypothetical protein